MKNLLTFFTLFISSIGFTQIISINDSAFSESGYGPEELIKEVMISSSCSTTDNFTFKVYGSPSDLTTKSYGYFKRPSGSTFPFEDVTSTTASSKMAGFAKLVHASATMGANLAPVSFFLKNWLPLSSNSMVQF